MNPAGALLFERGSPATGFYLLRAGLVKIFRLSPAGSEQVLHLVRAGESFAEAAVFQGGGYPAYAQCLVPSWLFFVERNLFLDWLRARPDMGLQVMAGMARKMRELVDLVEDLTLRDSRGRFCRYLVGLLPPGTAGPVTLRFPVGQSLLARHLGVAQETLSRAIRALSEEGILEMEGRRRVLVRDPLALRREAQ